MRKLYSNCVTGSGFTGKKEQPLMGDLPEELISVPSRVLHDAGINIGSPFFYKVP